MTTLAGGLPNIQGVAVDGTGNVYVGQYSGGYSSILKVTQAGVVTTVASGLPFGIWHLSLDNVGNFYARSGYSLCKVSSDGANWSVTLFGTALFDCVADGTGNVYVVYSDGIDGRIVKNPGSGEVCITDAIGTSGIYHLKVLAVDIAGNIYAVNINSVMKCTPLPALSINTQPQGTTTPLGNSVTLSVGATGLTALAYQWYLGSSPLAQATNANLTFTATPATSGAYSVVVTNTYGSLTSQVANVVVVDPMLPSSQPNRPARPVCREGPPASA